ncbi:hypothetical protein OG883_40005 [Streptomyces sp. NBC_01142]|uniref:hypothetical protein n=1 Tax=Streptomyces sp. NBC_01142 TaxID=2975865 RepID=UPI00224D5489|nr:hypothetical protein [Streptomyces sp. NBC_01142]MCX4825890.1 hypothetical protein [Streptomyces sp. NBC_01142]
MALGTSDCPELARDLLLGLVDLIYPHGTLRSWGSVEKFVIAVRPMTKALGNAGFTGGAGQLTRSVLAEYWLGADAQRESETRRMLESRDAGTSGLRPEVRQIVTGRRHFHRPKSQPFTPYSETEWDRLIRACRTLADSSLASYRAALAAAAEGADLPLGCHWPPSPNDLRRFLSQHDPLARDQVGRLLGQSSKTTRTRFGLPEARAELFPTPEVVIAYQLLFGAYTGIVPDGIDGLGLGDIDWAGDSTVLLDYVKGRTAKESVNLPKRAIGLLERWLEHSALLRSFCPPSARERLWVRHRPSAGVVAETMRISDISVRAWIRRYELLDDNGQLMAIHRQRIRTTYHVRRDRRAWYGSSRATIDPNHSPQVEGDRYLTVGTAAQRQAVEAIIEDAQADLLRRAQPPVVLADDDITAVIRDLPQASARLGLDDDAGRWRARRVHGRLRRPAHGPARSGRQAVPGPAVGLPALSARGVLSAARGEPAATQGVLRAAVETSAG